MKDRYIVCNWSFLGAGDRSSLVTTAEKLSGQAPIILDMDRMAGKNPDACCQAVNQIAKELRTESGNDRIVFLSTGIDFLHPLANTLKESLDAKWVDIRLDLNQDKSFESFPKMPGLRKPVDCAIGLKENSLTGLDKLFSKLFNSESSLTRHKMTTVPVVPDATKIDYQSRRFADVHPDMVDNVVVILLGSYINDKTTREINRVVTQAQADNRPIIFVTSPRTENQQKDVADKLQRQYGDAPGIHFHRFSATDPKNNIYPGVLAFSSDVVVTGDSLTMVSESIALQRRTHILPTMGQRTNYYDSLADKNLVRLCDKGLDTSWTPSPRPDPFAEIQQAIATSASGTHKIMDIQTKIKPTGSDQSPL